MSKLDRRKFIKGMGLSLALPSVAVAGTYGKNYDPGGPGTIKAAEVERYRKELPSYFYKRIPAHRKNFIGTTQLGDNVVQFEDARTHAFAEFFMHGTNRDYTGKWGQAVKKAMDDRAKLTATFTDEQKEDAAWGGAITAASDQWHVNLGPGRWESIGIKANKLVLPAGEMTAKIKKVAKWFGADLVGVCEITEDLRPFFYKTGRTWGSLRGAPKAERIVDNGRDIPWPYPYKYAIMIGKMEGIYGLKTNVGPMNNATVATECSDDDIYPRYLESTIRSLGYDAKAQSMNGTDDFNMIPLAVQAGLGELGRMGMLVTPYGAHVRLSAVTTNMPLLADDPIDFGLQEFCKTCKKCAENCPSKAINDETEPEMIGGVVRYQLDPVKCMTQRATTGCASCAAVCPFTKPDNILHSAGRIMGRNPLGAKLLKSMDDLFYGVQPTPRALTSDLAPWKL
ncbi:reductive dehalogenase [Desulfuromusa kysingii]|uniref:Reductive dehalogenase n=1 Tax=Desulfuromusa kysingii TaxID=37625 RepID=A0A1H4AZX0_9BACT|nr:reductive dehalogenase [Desulfuromusa kysingii]SEA41368.1 reductive dehalogenase [Desulfuromusa kysingii]